MACGSCGGGVYRPPALPGAVTGVAQPQTEKYKVTHPNGLVQEFFQRWRADQAQAMYGGSLEIIESDSGGQV